MIVRTHRVLDILSKNYTLHRKFQDSNLPELSELRLAWIAFLKDGRYLSPMLLSFKRPFARNLIRLSWVLERLPAQVFRFVGAKIST